MLRYIIFAPLAGALINWLVGRRLRNEKFIGLIACGSVLVSTLIAFYLAFRSNGALGSTAPVLDQIWTWIEVGRFRADFGLAMDRLSCIYALFITFVGFLIHVFATGYMHGDKGFYRFFAYLNLFMFSMLTLILADNFLLMFVGWEGVGLCSYLLIGYYIDRKEAGSAAKKAFIANRVGDWGVVLGIILIFYLTAQTGQASISFFDKPGVTSALTTIGNMAADPFTWRALTAGGVTTVAILLFIGATGKSAQIPLFVWLPDAMAGPTPVSALIHAATMVTAGVYMVVRCNAIFQLAPTAMFIVAVIGAMTAIFAATIGLAQNDIKKVLAYSTISQLGYMFLACGVGAFVAAIFHVMTHAFFKALLFLGSGSVIHGMHHEQDMRKMGGLKKYMPVTFATMLTGWLAISGIPIFAGFFSKDEILWSTWNTHAPSIPHNWGKVLWVVGAVTAGLTAIYMTRLMVMTFWGSERFRKANSHTSDPGLSVDVGDDHNHDLSHHGGSLAPHESPWTMTLPLVVLAVLSTIGGLVGVPYALSGGKIANYFEQALEPVIFKTASHNSNVPDVESSDDVHILTPSQHIDGAPAITRLESSNLIELDEETHNAEEVRSERIFTGISIFVALVGIGIGWVTFRKRPLLEMPRLLENKYYVDEIYDVAIINPIKDGSREGLWKIFDLGVIDAIVNGFGRSVVQIGALVRYLQSGFVRSYAAVILFGALLLVAYFAYIFALNR